VVHNAVVTADRVVLVQVSDLHLGADQRHLADALLHDVTSIRPDLTVVSGDLTMRARRHQFAAARAYLDVLPHPLLVVPGNHDLPLENVANRLSHPFRRYREHISEELDPALEVPGASVLGLNSMPRWRWKAGHVSPRQHRLVAEVLGCAPGGNARVLVTHHPVLPRDLSGFVGRQGLVDAAARARVDLLLAGHTHEPLVSAVSLGGDGEEHRAVSVVAGTAISDRLRGSTNSYPVITVTRATIEVTVRRWVGDRFVADLTSHFDRHPPERP
jgi:3',5'-cyclic AMP phosphodiesterase CpdA